MTSALQGTPFFVPTEETPLSGCGSEPVRAGVSALGLGGIAYHAVLEADAAKPVRPVPMRSRVEPLAVVGMGAVLPTGNGVEAFWTALTESADCTREVPPDRWDPARFYDPDPEREDTTYTRLGCFLEQLPSANGRLGAAKAAADRVDPSQLLLLDAAEEALEDAGIDVVSSDATRVGVMLGFLPYQGKKFEAHARVCLRELVGHVERALAGTTDLDDAERVRIVAEIEHECTAGLPAISAETLPGYLGSLNAAQIARRFGFSGTHYVVDAACASSHAAFFAAAQALRRGICDVVITGAAWCDIAPEFYVGTCRFNALSASGITPFDAAADGFVPGEGGGVLVLRRLCDAERDGQRVHAVIRSVGGSSDGRGASVLAPTVTGEATAMRRTLEAAELDPGLVDYVECHGTGTGLGDAVEVEAITEAYGTNRERPLFIGSVKSNIGHLNAAAGVPGLLKAVLAVREGMIPSSLKCRQPNPRIDFDRGRVRVVSESVGWEREDGVPRRAGVNGFGVGGANMHVVVEQHVATAAVRRHAPSARDEALRVLPIAVATGASFDACLQRLGRLVADASRLGAREYLDLAAASQRAIHGAVRVAVVAATPHELEQRFQLLSSAAGDDRALQSIGASGVFVGSPTASTPAVAMFPGQGPQYANMLADAAVAFPELGEVLVRADAAYREICGRALTGAFLIGDARDEQHHEDIHAAVLVVNCAVFELLRRYGFDPPAVLGQSAGELSALVAAGVLSLEDALLAIHERTRSVLDLAIPDNGRMAALGCSAEQARALIAEIAGYVVLAADNGPQACIISGETPAVQEAVERSAHQGVHAVVLDVSHAYHCELIAPARGPYLTALRSLEFATPAREVVSTIAGSFATELAPSGYPQHLARQLVTPVRLREAVDALYAAGTRLFVECGPKRSMTSFVGEILSECAHIAVPTLHPKVGEVEQIHRALACLFVHGEAGLTCGESIEPDNPPEDAPALAVFGDDAIALLISARDAIDVFLSKRGTERHEQRPAEACRREHVAGALAAPSPPKPEPAHTPHGATSAPSGAGDAAFERARALLVAEVVRRTGYPEDMLDLDLDLEADLSIDTVKQVAIVAQAREQLGLELDPTFKLRDHGTLRRLAEYLGGRFSGGATGATAVSVDPAVAITGHLGEALADLLGEAWETRPAAPSIDIAGLGLTPEPGGGITVSGRSNDGSVVVHGSVEHLADLAWDGARGEKPIAAAVPALELLAELGLVGDWQPVLAPEWAGLREFDHLVAELPDLVALADAPRATIAAEILIGGLCSAAIGWWALTGCRYGFVGASRLRVRPDARSGRLRVDLRLRAPAGAGWRADVSVSAQGRPVASIQGLTGRALEPPVPPVFGNAGAAAERWSAAAERLLRDPA